MSGGGAPRVSVVIPTLDVAATLGDLLDALSQEEVAGGFEVVVADNGSTDGTVELARGYADRLDVRVVPASRRTGAGAARNDGVQHARGELLVMLDGDDVISPGYLAAMAEGLGTFDLVGSATDPRPADGDDPAPGGTTLLIGTDSLRDGYLPWTSTSNMGVRREAFERVDGFDEDLHLGSEDQDLCWRVQLAGGTIGFVPEAVLRCHLPTSRRAGVRKGFRYGRAEPQMARKWVHHGQRPAPLGQVLRRLAATSLRCARARDPHERGHWGLLLGRNLGRLADRVRPLPAQVLPAPGDAGATGAPR